MNNKHNIELAEIIGESKIVVRGKKLNCKWIDKKIIIWSEND